MARTPRSAQAGRRKRRIARAGTLLALAGSLSLAVPAMTLAQADSPSPSPVVTEKPVPLDKPSRPVRVWVPYAGIDLPVISSDRNVPGNPRGYPLCDVAQYWTRFDMPGEPGTAWIIGHAQPGMFLPLYEETILSGKSKTLIGKLVKLQLRDGRLLTYRIVEVRPWSRSTDVSIANRPNKRQQRLVLQTSTGVGSAPKLEIAAKLLRAEWTDEPRPEPQPRACVQPPKPTPRNGSKTPGPTPTAEPELIESEDPLEAMTLVLGSGAVLLGASVVAVYLIRRP